MKQFGSILIAGMASLLLSAVVQAAPISPVPAASSASSMVIQVAEGCGPGAWRGPWGGCRTTPYYGPLPGGYYQEMPSVQQSCPIGYWRGPWGHCRNTPYHGPLPGGGFKP